VIVTVLPSSDAAGVYVNEKGESATFVGNTDPSPFSVIVTKVAFPPKELLLTVTGEVPQPVPLLLLK
jgi:hypothetical protein